MVFLPRCCVADFVKFVVLKEDVEEGIRRMTRRLTVVLKVVKSNGAPDPCHYVNPVAVLK